MLENIDKIMHLRFNFDACPMHSPFGFMHLTYQNLSVCALFCLNSLAKVNTQLLIYKYLILPKGTKFTGSGKLGLRLTIYRLKAAYLLLHVNFDKTMHACWDFYASYAQTQRVNELDKHQNWSERALFCHNSQVQSKYPVINLIHTWHKQTFLSLFICYK